MFICFLHFVWRLQAMFQLQVSVQLISILSSINYLTRQCWRLHLARASSKFLGRTIKDVELPEIKKVDCRDAMPYIVADICLKIVLHNDTEFGALQMVKGNKEVYEGHMVDTKTRKVIEDSQISLTVEKNHALVKILPTK